MSGAPAGQTRAAAIALLGRALRGGGGPAGPHLLVRDSAGAERAVAIGAGLTVGRGPAAALRLADPRISRLHARLLLLGDGSAAVLDLGSKNGIELNGRRVGPAMAPLRPGDEIRLGAVPLRFLDPLAGPGAPEAPARGLGASRPGAGQDIAALPRTGIGCVAGSLARISTPQDHPVDRSALRWRARAAGALLLLAAATALWDAAGSR
jgi:hypothetical protein